MKPHARTIVSVHARQNAHLHVRELRKALHALIVLMIVLVHVKKAARVVVRKVAKTVAKRVARMDVKMVVRALVQPHAKALLQESQQLVILTIMNMWI